MASQPVSHTQPASNNPSSGQRAPSTNPRWPTMVDGKRKTKKRVRNFTPADRAAHRVFEKSRREAFNDQLMELARLIPAISSAPRLSKHTIVNESIAYHRIQNKHCLAGIRGIQALLAERDELLKEVNSLRALLQPNATTGVNGRVARPLADDVVELMKQEAELTRTTDGETRQRQDSSSTDSPGHNRSPEGDVPNNAMQAQQLPDHQERHLDLLPEGNDLLSDVPQDFDFWEDVGPTQAIPLVLQPGEFNIDAALYSGQQYPPPLLQPGAENSMPHNTPTVVGPFGQDQVITQLNPYEVSAFDETRRSGQPQNVNLNMTGMTQTMPLY